MKKIIVTISLIVFAIISASALLFCWQLWGQITMKLPIDAIRFSNFGSFVGGIFGALSFILLIFIYMKSHEQSVDNSFFNLLQVHDSVVRELRSNKNEIDRLNKESKNLFESNLCESLQSDLRDECLSYRSMPDANDYFEILYRILHIRYKYKNEDPWKFFIDYNWRIGHYLKSFISIIEFIEKSKADNDKKLFYSRILKSRLTSDELRLIFYFIIYNKDENDKYRIAKMFKSFRLFKDFSDTLIKEGDMAIFKSYFE
jgi:hypothetical protein